MNLIRNTGLGRVRAGEMDAHVIPWRYPRDGSRRAVIWLHGAGGDYRVGPIEMGLMDKLYCPWVCADLGGLTWMGSTLVTAVDQAHAWAVANLGAAADKVILWGGSMGGANALYYALEHPENVAAVAGGIPALDPEYVRANNVGGFQASIEAVHGAGTVPADQQVYQRGAEWDSSVPGHLWYSENDGYTPLASTTEFLSESGVTGTSLGAVGHSYLSTSASAAADFLIDHAAA